jgi:hypothetical protein
MVLKNADIRKDKEIFDEECEASLTDMLCSICDANFDSSKYFMEIGSSSLESYLSVHSPSRIAES